MDLEGIMLSEISQTGKNKYHVISLICTIEKEHKAHQYREQIRVARAGKGG